MAVLSSELFFLASPSIQMVLPPTQLLKTKVWELSFHVSFGQCAVHQQMLSWHGLLLTLSTISPRLNSFAHVIFLFCTNIKLPKELLCFYYLLFYVYSVCLHLCMCILYTSLVPKKERRGHQTPWSQS